MEVQSKREKLARMARNLGMLESEIQSKDFRDSEILSSLLRLNVKDPQVTIRPDGIQFNNACIRLFEDVTHIYISYDRGKKWLVINECGRDEIDGQRWCNDKDGKLQSRKITGKDHSERVYRMMGWNKGYYYKVLGSLTTQIDDDTKEPYLMFELEKYHQIALTEKGRAAAGVSDEDVGEAELAKIRAEAERIAKERADAEARGEKPRSRRKHIIGGIEEDSFGTKRKDHASHIDVNQMTLEDYMSAGD